MAILSSVIKLKGSIGDLSFYKSIDGYVVRRAGGPSRERVKHAPEFARTRENNAEFGRAGKAVKLIRRAFLSMLKTTADARMTGRLTQVLLEAIKRDDSSDRGERQLTPAGLTLLTGFEFNKQVPLHRVIHVPFATTIDRSLGKLLMTLPEFTPTKMIDAPAGATHCHFMLGGAAIDFVAGTFKAAVSSIDIALDDSAHEAVTLTVDVPAESRAQLFLVAGVSFNQMMNGNIYPLHDARTGALRIEKLG